MRTRNTPFRKISRAMANPQDGTSLIELMIAMVVLAVGLGALTVLFAVAAKANGKSGKDTSATLLSQKVLETIAAQHPNIMTPIVMTDCAGNQWQIATGNGGAAANSPAGLGATLIPSTAAMNAGSIDWTETYAALPPATAGAPGYGMRYVDCGLNGRQTVYEVRWNVMTIDINTRLITVSARQAGTRTGGPLFMIPITLRGIGGV